MNQKSLPEYSFHTIVYPLCSIYLSNSSELSLLLCSTQIELISYLLKSTEARISKSSPSTSIDKKSSDLIDKEEELRNEKDRNEDDKWFVFSLIKKKENISNLF